MLIVSLVMAANIIPLQIIAQTSRSRNTYSASNQLKNYSSNSASTYKGNPGGNPYVPIDGGISLLIAAGVALGANKVHAKRKESKARETV
ncbi:hypothetical protein BH10BAC3_BH10BAC3_31080 [soil metagenome]